MPDSTPPTLNPTEPPNSKPRLPQRDGDDEETPRPSLWGPVIVIGLVLSVLLAMSWKNLIGAANEVDFSFFLKQLHSQNVAEVTTTGNQVNGKWKVVPEAPEGATKKLADTFSTRVPELWRDDPELRELLKDLKKLKADDATPQLFSQFLFGSMFLMAMLLVVFFIMRRSIDPSGTAFIGSFGKAGAKRFKPTDHRATFADVAAMESAKGELLEIVEFLKSPDKFHKLGADSQGCVADGLARHRQDAAGSRNGWRSGCAVLHD